MSMLLIGSLAVLLVAIVMVELRAAHAGDERRHHEVGYWAVIGGVAMIAMGIAAAASDHMVFTLLLSTMGLISVALGGARHREAAIH